MRSAASILLAFLLTPLALAGQADTVAPTVDFEILPAGTKIVYPRGSTVTIPVGHVRFWIDRPEMNRLRVRHRNDSIRIAKQDSALRDYAAAVDSLNSALAGCRQAKRGLRVQLRWKDTIISAERAARKALQDAQPSGLESLLDGPSGFVVGSGLGLTAGVLACRGAN